MNGEAETVQGTVLPDDQIPPRGTVDGEPQTAHEKVPGKTCLWWTVFNPKIFTPMTAEREEKNMFFPRCRLTVDMPDEWKFNFRNHPSLQRMPAQSALDGGFNLIIREGVNSMGSLNH